MRCHSGNLKKPENVTINSATSVVSDGNILIEKACSCTKKSTE